MNGNDVQKLEIRLRELERTRARVDECLEVLPEIADRIGRIERAFFDEPEGGGERLILRIVRLVETAERGGWAGKWIIRIIMTTAGLGAAILTIRGWVR
ncbi:hypothetical protein EKE94_03135 [Mesobaculum littorinae]|uniref:Uncharacterized protein n=1 Tax=Mesobaculum littorinae TaxID=2486419 RepID=A0A438AM07_9RHOB|nr:hypothetical protein [Mesobaculum littorinae]RVV99690.1 hypothetical protein EKE94_03135 [Mesobaculum littorinae]